MVEPLDGIERRLDEQEILRAARQHEREVAQLKLKLAQSEQKRKQAEQDLETSESRVDFIRSLGEPSGVPYDFKPAKPHGQATAVIVLSDWHVEETVDPATVNGLNEFNLDIADRRIQKTFENAVTLLEAARKLSNIKDLVVALLGDFITGYIHEELQEQNALSPTEACLFVQDRIVGGLDFLRKHSGCRSLVVPTCFGNHGRTTPKLRIASEAANSYEWLLYKQLERYYKNDSRVTWKVETGYHNWLNIQGHDVRFHHGHAIKYAGGIGGPTVPILKALAGWDQARRAAFDLFGHLHWPLRDEAKFACNNSLIGFGPFSLRIKSRFTPPSQTLVVFDRKRPLPVNIQQIWCD